MGSNLSLIIIRGNVRICLAMHGTRFLGFSTISSCGFTRLSSILVGLFPEIVPMFVANVVANEFAWRHFVALICVNFGADAHFCTYLHDEGTAF